MVKIGVVSDTHGVIHPRAFHYLEGTDMILHAGDIGSEEVLLELEALAPVTAVSGNTDVAPLAFECREREIIEIGGRIIYLAHRVMEGGRYLPYVLRDIGRVGPDVVVFGHTHRQHAEWMDGILFFNPGGAGHRRPGTKLGVGLLTIGEEGINHETFYLE